MKELGHVRIDDRLIHGQIVSSWIDALGCKEIVIADDKAAKDEFQKVLLQMACPSTIKLSIIPIAEAAEYLINNEERPKVLVIVRDVKSALELTSYEGVGIDHINVGNISSGKNRVKYTKSVWMNEEEIADFKKLNEQGVELIIQVVPSERSIDLMTLI
ncbi:MAG TPA: PTS sugar transporter subunit IIB [Erysipelotrichaceae bacterium]|jgi:mannose/fructose/N-acetylgalactosamine-specific phosphotransferase system component IIB|nr:PTS sugar transporter subunit IIB [Erysipelotrichia bacterium]HPX31987.1 PTS sugar transporter subunit IIB [Erysipelotrichaceae bacterium]HQA84972.1 PTS sugar transporter subunit IIB [Erysipelotrichaceae bacterium]